jgi:phosphatidylserine/phosphatidylglycerophosphate/cardiolipin synthase-like enzyme
MESVEVIKNEEFLAAALGLLALARERVDICTYKFELSQRTDAKGLNSLIDLLYILAGQNVEVRILLNTTRARSGLTKINENAARVLKKHGILVRTLPDGRCQHAKILLVDGCMGIIGSHNWSTKSITENFEVAVIIRHAGHLQRIQEHFDMIWDSSKEVK